MKERGHTFSRKTAILAGLFAPSAVLAACRKEQTPNNSALVADFKSKLGITAQTTRQEFAQSSAKRSLENSNWSVGTKFEMTSEKGNKIVSEVAPDGELNHKITTDIYTSEYPDPRQVNMNPSIEKFNFPDNRSLNVYATSESTSIFKKNKSIAELFLKEYFSMTPIPCTLHLVFLPSSIALVGVENFRNTVMSPTSSAHTGSIISPTGEMKEALIVLNLPRIHGESTNVERSLSNGVIAALANEMTNLVARYVLPPQDRTKPMAETTSSFAGILASLDKDFARMILGGTAYEPFVKLVANEMQRVGKVKKAA